MARHGAADIQRPSLDLERVERVDVWWPVSACVAIMAPDAEHVVAWPPHDISWMTEPLRPARVFGISGRTGRRDI